MLSNALNRQDRLLICTRVAVVLDVSINKFLKTFRCGAFAAVKSESLSVKSKCSISASYNYTHHVLPMKFKNKHMYIRTYAYKHGHMGTKWPVEVVSRLEIQSKIRKGL